jgi:hypothetical protein
MLRQITHAVLLFVGIGPASWAICVLTSDPRRAAVLAALAALGFGLNGTALARPDFGIRRPLRVMACGVGLAVLASVMAMWHQISTNYLPYLPASGNALGERFALVAGNLLWVAAGVAYVLVTVLALPEPARKAGPPGDRSDGHLDSRGRAR